MKKFILLLLLLFTLSACNNKKITHGTNPADISGALDLKTFKPTSVEYNLTQLGDGNLGPSDYVLEAVLYYDTATFARLKEACEKTIKVTYEIAAEPHAYNFEWLPKSVKQELLTYPAAITPYPGAALSKSNPNCSIVLLNNKALVYYFTT